MHEVHEEQRLDDCEEEEKDVAAINPMESQFSYQSIACLRHYKIYDILRHDHVLKQSYKFFRVERELYLFRDGSIAYLEQ